MNPLTVTPTATPRGHDAHLLPPPQRDPLARIVADHLADTRCWCFPRIVHEDVVTGGRVWRHKRES